MIFEKIYFMIKQKFCKHRFRKHFDTQTGVYLQMCEMRKNYDLRCERVLTWTNRGKK